MKTLGFLATLAVGFLLAAPPVAAQAPAADSKKESVVELGKIAPDGPYRLWTSVNKVLLEYALVSGGKGLRSQVEGLSAGQFDGKTPGEVLAQTVQYRNTLERLRNRLKLSKVPVYVDPLGRAVTPGVVFVNAGHIMDATVAAFFTASDKPDESFGDLYDVPVTTGKTPSDVFALVSLATRRLQLIAAF